MQKVPQREAPYQNVRPVAHALILIDDAQQGGIADYADEEHQARDHRVNVFEGVSDLRGARAHGRYPPPGHGDVPSDGDRVSLDQSGLLGGGGELGPSVPGRGIHLSVLVVVGLSRDQEIMSQREDYEGPAEETCCGLHGTIKN